MPNFSNTPPLGSTDGGYRLVRTPPTAKFAAHVISEQLIGCPTHFVGNRTVPCEAPDCKSCDSGIGYRWHGYLLVQIDSTQEVVIFEMTKKASAPFTVYHERHGTTRGCHFQAHRLSQKANGRILIQCKTGDLTRVNLPPTKCVKKLLCHIWNIAPLQVEQTKATPAQPAAGLRVHRDQPELQVPPQLDAAIPEAVSNHVHAKPNNRPVPTT